MTVADLLTADIIHDDDDFVIILNDTKEKVVDNNFDIDDNINKYLGNNVVRLKTDFDYKNRFAFLEIYIK